LGKNQDCTLGNPYFYTRQNDSATFKLVEETPQWSRHEVIIPSAQGTVHLPNSQIKGEYYIPGGVKRAPLAIIIHGMAAKSVTPGRKIAATLAKKGFACFILYLLFHDFRAPASLKVKYPRLTAEEWFESYQTSVTDIRQVIDWAENRPELDHHKTSLVGISFGGFVSTIAMALDRRIRAGVLIISGGNSEKITRHGWLLRWQYRISPAEYRGNQEAYFRYLNEVAAKGLENALADKNSYLTDPLTFARYLKGRPILMLNAHWDEIIPRVATVDLWNACGKPTIAWYPATHSSIWVWYPWLGRRISGFLQAQFG
jgi:dienelactone hydrolase